MKKMYETAMINRGGRDGEVEAPNGSMHMKIDRPGIHSEGTNPEQLLRLDTHLASTARFNTCWKKIILSLIPEVKARVSLFPIRRWGYQIGVVLEVSLPGLEKDQAEKIAEEAHAFCPYSKATRGNIDVEVTIVE